MIGKSGYVPESFHHHLRTQPDFPIIQSHQPPPQPPAYTQEAPISAKVTPQITAESETRSQNIGTATQQVHVQNRGQPNNHQSTQWPQQQQQVVQDVRLQQDQLRQDPRSEQRPDPRPDPRSEAKQEAYPGQFASLGEVERRRHISNRNMDNMRERRTSVGMSDMTNATLGGMSTASSSFMSGSVPMVDLAELAEATNNWDERNKIGEGGYGTVYKGRWKHQEVAIKRIRKKPGASEDDLNKAINQLFKEIWTLSCFRSEYIVPIITFSDVSFSGTSEPAIVYQWMPNGSLEERLKKETGKEPLTWRQRYEIAKGTANGLQFLHSDHVMKSMEDKKSKALIHGDIKSANILLDKNLLPKIGDFGIAREVDGELNKSKYTLLSSIHGTKWYLPEDFLRTKTLTVTVDTYSFGVVLFDMVTGRSPHVKVRDGNEMVPILDLMKESSTMPAELVDEWKDSWKNSQLSKILYKEGMKCTQEKARNRPKMKCTQEKARNR